MMNYPRALVGGRRDLFTFPDSWAMVKVCSNCSGGRMIEILEKYRDRIAALDYTPLTDDELAAVRAADRSAVASAAIEGLKRSELGDAFAMLLLEMRVPPDIGAQLVVEFTKDTLDPAQLAA